MGARAAAPAPSAAPKKMRSFGLFGAFSRPPAAPVGPAAQAQTGQGAKAGLDSQSVSRLSPADREDFAAEAPCEEAGPYEPCAPMQVKKEMEVGARVLSGRLVLAKGRELVFEIDIDAGGLSWEPESVEVVFDEGAIAAAVDASRTTAPMSVGPGQVVRLAVTLAVEAFSKRPRSLALVSNGCSITVELR